MKFSFNFQVLGQNPENYLRRAGYALIPGRGSEQQSFARRLSRDFYPRFHIYYQLSQDNKGQKIVNFNLHLDQKKPGYVGFSRHNGEYDGVVVEREVQRLQSFIAPHSFI